MADANITTMDRAGRIVIPREVRRAARWPVGAKLQVRAVDGRVEIEPAAAKFHFERRRGHLVAVHEGGQSLPMDTVIALVDEIREARAASQVSSAKLRP